MIYKYVSLDGMLTQRHFIFEYLDLDESSSIQVSGPRGRWYFQVCRPRRKYFLVCSLEGNWFLDKDTYIFFIT